MKLGKTIQLELPRRVAAFYLLFCLISVLWLSVGVILVSRSVFSSHAESACLAHLAKAASAVEMDYLRSDAANLPALVQRFKSQASLAYCAVVSREGRYVAHTSRSLVGQRSRELIGEHLRWGDFESVRFIGENGQRMREYRAPLKTRDHEWGTLCFATSEPKVAGLMLTTARYAPLAFLGPLVLMGLGAVVLQRMVRPLAEVETQLRRAAISSSLEAGGLQRVPMRNPVSLGWNRVVDELAGHDGSSQLQQRLQEAAQQLRQDRIHDVLNSLPEGVALTDPDGAVTFANQAFRAFVGTGDADLQGATVPCCFDLPTQDPENLLLNARLSGRSVVSEVARGSGSGERVLRVARHPLRAGDGASAAGHIWTVRDVTQQKLADRMRDDFIDSATHELRTPLANIKAYAETIAVSDVLEIEQQKEFCNTINTEATRLARFIDELLSVSSIESGSLSISKQQVEVARLLPEVIAKVRPTMDQKEIEFQAELQEKLPEMLLDKDKIATTLVNLLGNAAKYTPQGGRVMLRAKVIDDQLVVEVEDTGIGISEEEQARVFEKFFRSQDQRVQDETGNGLGLSLAQEVVRLHGGSLTLRSELNRGSTFAMTLPLTAATKVRGGA